MRSRTSVTLGVLVLLVIGLALPDAAKAAVPVFGDVATDHPYREAIASLAGRDVVGGFPDGTFRPDSTITRQQFAKMIAKATGLEVTGNEVCPFSDVAAQLGSDPLYPSKYVAACAAGGITVGKTATTFGPGDTITRQQLITMVTRAAGLEVPPETYVPSFAASGFSLGEHYLNARKASYSWLLHGIEGFGAAYDFVAPSTRGECAQILYNLERQKLPAGATLLVADDFTTRWANRPQEEEGTNPWAWAYDALSGEYACTISTARLQSRQAPEAEYVTFSAEVDAHSRSAAEAGYGLVFGVTPGWDEFYEFIVSNQGYWQLWRKAGNEWSPVTEERDNLSAAIARGSAWNELLVTVGERSLSVSVNHHELFALSGVQVSPGRIAFLAESEGSSGQAAVAFDDYRVWTEAESALRGQ